MPLELVVSDLDGTILETEDYHRRAYNVLFGELGLVQRWSKEDYSKRLATMGGEKFREVFRWLDRPRGRVRGDPKGALCTEDETLRLFDWG